MKLSLQTRVSILITVVLLLVSAVSTYLFTSAHNQSMDKSHLLRGSTLCYTLSKAAEEGLSKEDLNILKKAEYIIQAPDVSLVQVYSNLWDAVDAYPFNRLNQPPDQRAVQHFKH
jgi:hypothetical protein